MNRLLPILVAGVAGLQVIPMEAESRPKLVVGIMVDQLRTDYLDNLKDMFGYGGFRRLMNNGVYFKDIDFKVPYGDAASATAIIQTGDYPRHNGVPGEKVYDQSSKSLKPVFQDNSYIGNFTNETYSPAALRVSTLTDEIAVENRGKSKIHSIAPSAAQAIVLAGHSGNSAFWINDETGRWSSSTYYSNPPTSIQNRNYNQPLISRLDTMVWTPLRKGEPYPFVSTDDIREGFRYNFTRSDRDVFSYYKQSPFVNRDITDVASEYIKNLNLGKGGETTDVLNLGYTLAVYPGIKDENYRYELEDAYLRLDKDLERLFNTIDRSVGRDNVLIYLVSTGYVGEPVIDNPQYRLPGGTFSVKRALSLLNAYFAAKYGNGAYVDEFADGQIYLIHSTLENKNLEPDRIAEEARDFLVRMSGVADAFTMNDLMSPALPKLESWRMAIDPKAAGDVLLEFSPGWTIVDDSRFPSVTQDNKTNAYSAPGFIMGADIQPMVIENAVDATSIAPTLAKSLRIRAPNSSSSRPVALK